MVIEFTDAEIAAVEQLASKQDMSETAVLRQALRLYQLVQHRLENGETVSFSGDAERIADFTGNFT